MIDARTSPASGVPSGRPVSARRSPSGRLLGLLAAIGLVLVPAAANAATSLTVVGTSDVNDSGLIPNLIKPGFEHAYPQYTLNYVSLGTGAAITAAESGTASALLVHAASLENQFVAGIPSGPGVVVPGGPSYSLEPFGRAIFYGDYVLLGPSSDPAGVMTDAPHDIVKAFQDIAAAGAAGTADFVSRGGSPGTTVEEHTVWSLTSGPPSLTLCTVSAANGGGASPSTGSGACPSPIPLPSWYHATGLPQGANITAADTCNFANATANGHNDCYVLTDRGTFEFLQAQTPPLSNLQIVTRDNSATAPGGQTLLTNSFHAYAINPAAHFIGNPDPSTVHIDTVGATDFLNYLTSPAVQASLKDYLPGATNDPPFIADAAPALTASALPAVAQAGAPVTVTGTVKNSVPGTPPVAGQTVTLSKVGGGLPSGVPVGSARTDSGGGYSITFVPSSNGSYQVSTGLITQIEDRSLRPIFGDLLQPAASAAQTVNVQSAVTIRGTNLAPGEVVVDGSVLPGSGHAHATVTILARKQGSSAAFSQVGGAQLAADQGSYAIPAKLAAGKWQLEASFQDAGVVLPSTSAPANVTVPATPPGPSSVKVTKVKLSKGKLTLTGAVSPAATKSGGVVRLYGLRTTSLTPTHISHAKLARSAAASFPRVGRTSVKTGATKFTIHAKLRRGYRWILQLEYVPAGQHASFSRLRTVKVR